MRALTLTQPWSTLVALGEKRIETRSWSTNYRGPLAIHAAKGFPRWARQLCADPAFIEALKSEPLPMGVIVCTCRLVDCLPMEATGCLPGVFEDYPELDTRQEREFGDYSPGRWAWILEDVKRLPEPVPAKGKQGLWYWDKQGD